MYSSDPTNTETYVEFCRVKLQLHHPFRDATDILKIHGVGYPTHQAAFDACQLSHDHGDDFYADLTIVRNDDEFEDEDYPEEEIQNSWEPLAAQLPGREDDALKALGQGNIDLQYDPSRRAF